MDHRGPQTGFAYGPPEGLCLDFANTRCWRGTATPTEELRGPGDLLRWCEKASVLDPNCLAGLVQRWAAHPSEAHAAHARAIMAREAIYRVFLAASRGSAPDATDLAALDDALRSVPGRS
ncbi:MAG TPA: ABATE domain-containing protein, partial [Acetobacteraceae bacterium]